MVRDGSGSAAVHACNAFHVRTEALEGFYESAGALVASARAETGCACFNVRRELDWARRVSDESQQLVMVHQEWRSAGDLEAHTRSAQAQQFDRALVEGSMLACAPNVSIFGPAMGPDELRALAGQVRAALGEPGAAAASSGPLPPRPPPLAGAEQPQPGRARAGSRERSGGSSLARSGSGTAAGSRPGSASRGRPGSASQTGSRGAAGPRASSSSAGAAWR
ncbi:unnamed protein product [Prorocentrum cordatum]|uniref:ABM domain-containing protein n=1 Tax=Prorocentrum cordatum TaxID=2364126 RepID=A0ABN9QCW0_9DINO|nr:unnamed protein product [Polarella glacialis]